MQHPQSLSTVLQNGPATGEYSTIAAIDNTGRALPGGFQNTPLSASQLAAAQSKAAKGTQPYAATAPTSSGASDGQQVPNLPKHYAQKDPRCFPAHTSAVKIDFILSPCKDISESHQQLCSECVTHVGSSPPQHACIVGCFYLCR